MKRVLMTQYLERFRVKTQASWGAGHVDHNVPTKNDSVR